MSFLLIAYAMYGVASRTVEAKQRRARVQASLIGEISLLGTIRLVGKLPTKKQISLPSKE
jgi:hypothetical protein